MIKFKRLEITDTAQLEELVLENFNNLENGLVLIDRHLSFGGNFIDIMAVDSEKRPVLINLAIEPEEDMLLSAIDAHGWFSENIDILKRMYPVLSKDLQKTPRVFILASHFPDTFKKRIRYLLSMKLELIEYKYLEVNESKGLLFDSVRISSISSEIEKKKPVILEYPLAEEESEVQEEENREEPPRKQPQHESSRKSTEGQSKQYDRLKFREVFKDNK